MKRIDDTGSLALAQLLTLVGVMLSALLAPMLMTQLRSTREDAQRVHALHAAQSGLDVALAHIRAASDSAGHGITTSLPCGPLSGTVDAGGSASYDVTVDYFTVDPRGQTAAWITANRIPCTSGSGPAATPAYALLRAQGTDPAGAPNPGATRSVQAVYPFRAVGRDNVGGLVHVFAAAGGADLCLDAGSGVPAAGTDVQVRTCDPGSDQQRFAYQSNLTLVLVASRTTAGPLGMCLDAAPPHAAGRVVQVQPCATTTRAQQQWTFDANGNFAGTADGTITDGSCFNVQTPGAVGSFVVLGTTGAASCGRGPDGVETFAPEAAVGTGAAGATAGQVTNLGEFARCLDVTGQSVAAGYLTAWPCAQSPDPAAVGWDQKWTLPAVAAGATTAAGRVTTTAPGGTYCLLSPGSTAPGQYVRVTACPGGAGTPVAQTWTVSTDTGTYATSYRLADGYGNCLTATDPNATPADLYPGGRQISKLVVAACDGTARQKWNAPPGALHALPLIDVAEQ